MILAEVTPLHGRPQGVGEYFSFNSIRKIHIINNIVFSGVMVGGIIL